MRVKAIASVIGFLAFAVAGLPRTAESTTINFASLETSGTLANICCGTLRDQGTFVSVDGFNFTSSNSLSYGLSLWVAGDLSHPVGGLPATSLFEYLAGATTTMTRAENGIFTLTGIDFTEWGAGMFGGTGTFGVTLVGTKSDLSTVTQTVQVSRNAGSPELQSFVLTGFDNVTKVTMVQGVYGGGTAFQFNNLIVDSEVSSVPESGSALSLLSVAGIGLIAYRRRLKPGM